MSQPPVELAQRAVQVLAAELRRRASGEEPDPFFDPYVDQLADAGEEFAKRDWPGEANLRRRLSP